MRKTAGKSHFCIDIPLARDDALIYGRVKASLIWEA
jgi:hypothetical protein